MNTTIESINFDADSTLKNLILERTSGFAEILKHIESCKVTLELKKTNEGQVKVVEISLNDPESLFGKEQAITFELALDSVVYELKQKLAKYKLKKENADVLKYQKIL